MSLLERAKTSRTSVRNRSLRAAVEMGVQICRSEVSECLSTQCESIYECSQLIVRQELDAKHILQEFSRSIVRAIASSFMAHILASHCWQTQSEAQSHTSKDKAVEDCHYERSCKYTTADPTIYGYDNTTTRVSCTTGLRIQRY